ncbi:MAG: FlgO family outer membrane protein [Devosia sp.]
MNNLKGALFGLALAACNGLQAPLAAEVSGTVEEGLGQLAQAIVEKSNAADRTTIAILPFANADGTCSVLSSYIVDELTLRLFSVTDSKLEIVERSQLEALLAEMKTGASGLLNPETTKQLGNLSGVSALALGTITVIGDQIRVNARLVATDTGKTISAAAVNIPKTSAIEELLAQPVTTGLICGGPDSGSASVGKPAKAGGSGKAGTFTQGELQFEVASISRLKDHSRVTVALQITNIGTEPKNAIWVKSIPVLIDNAGGAMYLSVLAGLNQCHTNYGGEWFNSDPKYCAQDNRDFYVTLWPGNIATVNLVFAQWKDGTGDKTMDGDSVSFAGVMQVIDSDGSGGDGVTRNISVSIPGIAIPK